MIHNSRIVFFTLTLSIFLLLYIFINAHIYSNTSVYNDKCYIVHANDYANVLSLKYLNNKYKLNFNDFMKSSDNFVIQSKHNKWGRDGNRDNAVFAINSIVKMGLTYERAFEFIFNGINDKIDKILKKIDIEPKDSKIIFTPNFVQKFQVTIEKTGHKVDKEQLYKSILEKYLINSESQVELITHEVVPNIKKSDNLKATHKLSSFSTDISKSSSDRKHNVKKALLMFNGMRIEPNQIVSFNKTTGRRTIEKGYKTAHIILNEVFVDGVGGGVCQSSTTLYNALILADNVNILQSSRHSMPVSYVQMGFDAMVSYGTSDLVFQNTGDYPIFLHTYSKNDKVVVDIYGKPNDNQYIKKRRTEIIKTFDAKPDKIVIDKKGEYIDKVQFNDEKYRLKHSQKGYEVQTYIDYYDGNDLIKSEPVRHCTYPAQEGIIIQGAIERSNDKIDDY